MNIIQKIAASLDPEHIVETEDERDFGEPSGGHRAAAVLVPITQRDNPGVILTQRPEWLKSHPGQVAFPGGKIDDGDSDAIAAALREADEELAIPPDAVEILGTADVYYSGSGFAISPVVGVVPPDMDLVPCPGEVEDWFEVPLEFLLDMSNAEKRSGFWKGSQRAYYDIDWQGRRIWGVTAGIIANLVRRVEAL